MRRLPEEEEELRRKLENLLELKFSESKIADRLGMTKGQVSGLINKLVRRNKHYKKPAEFAPPTSGPRPRPSQPTILAELPIVRTDLSFEPLPGKVNVWNVKRGQCRWVDDEGFFCADPTIAPTKSYCKTHHQICFYKLTPKVKTACLNSLPSPSVNFA